MLIARSIDFYITIFIFPCWPISKRVSIFFFCFSKVQHKEELYRSMIEIYGPITGSVVFIFQDWISSLDQFGHKFKSYWIYTRFLKENFTVWTDRWNHFRHYFYFFEQSKISGLIPSCFFVYSLNAKQYQILTDWFFCQTETSP